MIHNAHEHGDDSLIGVIGARESPSFDIVRAFRLSTYPHLTAPAKRLRGRAALHLDIDDWRGWPGPTAN